MPLTKVSFSVIQVANNVTSTTVGNTTSIPSITFDQNGVITAVSNNTLSIANTQITGVITASQLATSLNLATNNVQVASIQSATGTPGITFAANGQMTLANTPLQLTGGQIKFPGTQIASGDANTLDDYEEGTWTPTASPSSGSYNGLTTAGYYVKVGRSVTVFCYWYLTASGDAGGNWSIGGLPFTVLSTGSYGAGSRGALMLIREDAQTGESGQAFWNNNSTSGQIQKYTGANFPWTTNYMLVMSGTYQTTA